VQRLLENTYCEIDGEPAAWRQLYAELQAERRRLESLALSAMNVRGRLEPDDERIMTRFSNQRQISLLLLRQVSTQVDREGTPGEVQLLSCHRLKANTFRTFNLPAARQLHLNTAPIPAWWLPWKLRRPLPCSLAQYFPGEDVAMAVYEDARGPQLMLDCADGSAPAICYNPLTGLWLDRAPARDLIQEDYDGESEDGIF
jgi:hypothetical protein